MKWNLNNFCDISVTAQCYYSLKCMYLSQKIRSLHSFCAQTKLTLYAFHVVVVVERGKAFTNFSRNAAAAVVVEC